MAPKTDHKIAEFTWQKLNDDEQTGSPTPPGRLRAILNRAALAYLGLFLGLSAVMSMLGLDPLIHNGALPKCLLVYVGLAVIWALANSDTSMVEEQTRSWLALAGYRSRRERSGRREL